MTERFYVKKSGAGRDSVAEVCNRETGDSEGFFSRRWSGARYLSKARDLADRLNASDARVAWNAAHEDLLPYTESRDYQRDMED